MMAKFMIFPLPATCNSKALSWGQGDLLSQPAPGENSVWWIRACLTPVMISFKSFILGALGPDITGKAKLSSTLLSALGWVEGYVVFQPKEKETWHHFQLHESDRFKTSVSSLNENLELGWDRGPGHSVSQRVGLHFAPPRVTFIIGGGNLHCLVCVWRGVSFHKMLF